MFLPHIETLGLIKPSPESNILKKFSLQVKKNIASEVTKFLQQEGIQNQIEIFSTPAHVRWVLESVGSAFSLPLEDETIIDAAVDLYRQWLLSPPNLRPQGIKDDEQYFYKEMYLHMSLLFANKEANTPEKTAAHIRLCRAVLTVYLTSAHKLGPNLVEATWEAWLKTLMAVVDHIYHRGPKDQLHIELFPMANQVLHESWLLSKTTNSSLWLSFGDLARTWLNSSAVLQWCATSFGLTRAQLYRLYGPEWGTPNVSLEVALDEKTTAKTTIELETDTIYYFWYRMINIIGNLHTTLRDPELNRLAYNGLNKIVDAYLEACKNPPPNKTPPSGNTIIQLFGKWMFDAVLEDKAGLDRRFSPTYLSLFCFSLNKMLQKDISDKVLISVLVNTRQLFTQQIEGINVLIPAFLYAFSKVWTKTGPEANVRGACIDIMSTIIGMPTHYKDTKLCSLSLLYEITYPKEEGNPLASPPHDVLTYSQIDAHLRMLLLRGLSFEESSRNLQKILWCIQILMVDLTLKQGPSQRLISQDDEKFVKYVVTRILNSITSGTWSADVIQTSYQVLSCMTPIYPCLSAPNKLARLIIETLSNHVIKSLENRNTCVTQAQREDNERILIGAYQSISDWLVATDWPKKKGVPKKLAELLAKAITVGLTVSKDPSPKQGTTSDPTESVDSPRKLTSSEKIKDAAECVLTVLTRVMGAYPSFAGPQSMSCVVSEEDLYKQITQEYCKKQTTKVSAKQFNRIFLLDDNVILSAFDLPSANGDEVEVVLIVRDKSGRYCWTAELRYFDKFRPKNKIATPATPAANSGNPPSSPHLSDSASEQMVNSTGAGTEPAEMTDAGFDDCIDAGDPVIPVEDDAVNVLPIDLQSKLTRGDFTEILAFIEKKRNEQKLSEQILVETAAQVETEREYLKKNQYGMNNHITFQVPKKRDIYAGDCKFQHSRIFLNHLGLLSPSNVSRLSIFDTNSASFMNDLKLLDQVSERDTLQIGVVYVSKGQTTAETVYSNTLGTRDYADFLASLGWMVDLSKHTGFKGDFAVEPVASQPNFSNKAIYHADYSTELLFAVSTLMSTDSSVKPKEGEHWVDLNHDLRKKIISHSNVVVVWIDDFDDYRPKQIQTIGIPSLIRSHTPPPTPKEVLTPKEFRLTAVVDGHSPPGTREVVSSSSEDKIRSPITKRDGLADNKKMSLSDDKLQDRRRKHGSIGRGTPTKIVAGKTATPVLTLAPINQTGVHIIIQPLQSGLYRLRTLRDGRPVMIGPILDNMIVGKHLLADLVRRTAVFANKLIRSKPDNPWLSPLTARQMALHQLAVKYKREMTLEEFYTALLAKNSSSVRGGRSTSRGAKDSTLKVKLELEMLQNAAEKDENVFSDDEDVGSPRTKKEKREKKEKEKKEKK